MNIESKFISKPFKEFKKFHIELNKYVKVSTCSIDYLRQSTDDKDELNTTISILFTTSGERWLSTKYAKPFDELNLIKSQLSQSSIMWVFSSFEVFLNLVYSSYSEAIQNKERPERTEQTESIRLKELFERFNWDLKEIEYLIPVFDFYGLTRHCIVHNMGTTSEELKKLRFSEEFNNAIENWPTVIKGRKLSSPPEIDSNRKIILTSHHPITYSDICYRISKVVNQNIYKTLGIEYFILKTVKETIIDRTELFQPSCKDVYAYINYQLKNEYNIPTIENPKLRQALEAKSIRKKVVAKYGNLKKKIE